MRERRALHAWRMVATLQTGRGRASTRRADSRQRGSAGRSSSMRTSGFWPWRTRRSRCRRWRPARPCAASSRFTARPPQREPGAAFPIAFAPALFQLERNASVAGPIENTARFDRLSHLNWPYWTTGEPAVLLASQCDQERGPKSLGTGRSGRVRCGRRRNGARGLGTNAKTCAAPCRPSRSDRAGD